LEILDGRFFQLGVLERFLGDSRGEMVIGRFFDKFSGHPQTFEIFNAVPVPVL